MGKSSSDARTRYSMILYMIHTSWRRLRVVHDSVEASHKRQVTDNERGLQALGVSSEVS